MYGSALIELTNGSEIPASQVRAGMVIMSYNPAANALAPSVVSTVISRKTGNMYIFNNVLRVDAGEDMLINGNWTLASNAKVGDSLFDPLTGKSITITSITSNYNVGTQTVYDFLAAPYNNYIADGYLIDAVTSTSSISGSGVATLANGNSESVSQLTPGTVLMGYDTNTNKLVPTVLEQIYPRTTHQLIIINNGALIVDGGEGLYINGKLALASTLKVGDTLFNPIQNMPVPVTSIRTLNGTFTLYDTITTPTSDLIVNGYLIT